MALRLAWCLVAPSPGLSHQGRRKFKNGRLAELRYACFHNLVLALATRRFIASGIYRDGAWPSVASRRRDAPTCGGGVCWKT